MARRLNVQRVMLVMAVLVVALGAVSVWAVYRGYVFDPDQTSASDRALRQLREQRGRRAEIRLAEPGEGRALCGYAGDHRNAPAFTFISRPNRILFSDDPLQAEFRDMQRRFCPDMPMPPRMAAVP